MTATANAQTHTEMSSRELYVSGIAKDGEGLWFHFTEPLNKRQLAVWLQLKRNGA